MNPIREADTTIAMSGVKAIVYGESGAGKTLLCSTLPAALLINAEGGLLSLKSDNIRRVYGDQALTPNVPVISVSSLKDAHEVYQWLSTSGDSYHYGSIYIDSLSEIAELVLEDAKTKNRDLRMAYADCMNRMLHLIRQFRDLPGKHVVMACKEMELESGMHVPSLPGAKLVSRLPYFFDEIFHLAIGKNGNETFRYIATRKSDRFLAKDRSGALAEFEYPHLGNIIQKILQPCQPA